MRSVPDRLTLLNGVLLLLVAGAAWAAVVVQTTSMPGIGGTAMADMAPATMQPEFGIASLAAFVLAWVVMMSAMMVPSAMPMVLLYRTVARGQAARGKTFVPTWVFVLGYLLVWAGFGVLVYVASQFVTLVLASSMTLADLAPYWVAAVLLIAGGYQFTPLKRVCLRACQSPLAFLMRHWKPGLAGALRMGVEHGIYCCGCCWGLMAVLVAAGAMGLAWVVLIALAVFVEKLLSRGVRVAWGTGLLLIALGILLAFQPSIAMLVRA
jgi:predicted metal-binding membrane protein